MFLHNDRVTFEGDSGVVLSVSGGWTTVEFAGGKTKKIRNSKLKKSMPTPTPPKREPAPAHFVGEGKTARVKDTVFNLSRYFISDVKTVGGRRTLDCADDVATTLRGLPIDEVYSRAAAALQVPETALREQYKHLNLGMQRMNLGNRIRGAAKK